MLETEIEKDQRKNGKEADGDGDGRFRPSPICRLEWVPRLKGRVGHGKPKSSIVVLTDHRHQTLVHLADCLVLRFHRSRSREATAPGWRSDSDRKSTRLNSSHLG